MGGHRKHGPIIFKDSGKAPLSCNFAALLKNFENAK